MTRSPRGLQRVRAVASALWIVAVLGAALAQSGGGAGEAGASQATPASAIRSPSAFERTFDGVVALVRDTYWDPEHLDWDAWADAFREAAAAAEDRAAFDAVMGRMLRALADDHSMWVGLHGAAASPAPPDVAPAPPRLGVQFAFEPGRGLVVERVYPDAPAAAAGLRRADVIVAVEGVPLATLASRFEADAVLRRALEGGPVTLSVERRRVPLEVRVEAEPVRFGDVAGAPYATMLDERTGYLAVPTFNGDGVAAAAHARLAELVEAGAATLVLDLRGNLGGRLLEAGLLLGAFLEGPWADAIARGAHAWTAEVAREGTAVRARLVGADGTTMGERLVGQATVWRGPLVVVVGAETVSAGELVALALQDRGRARVVGEATAGNVEAVQGFTLGDGSRLLLAVADLRGPGGLAYAGGVAPDVVVRSERSELARGLDAPVAEARRLLGALPFTPDRRF